MAEIAAIASALSGLQAASNIAKSFLDLRDTAQIQGKVIELQSVILATQTDALAAQASERTLLDQINELEEQIAQLKAWEAEKKRYKLEERAPGVFAYHVKAQTRGTEPDHWICATCYERGLRSVLQQAFTNSRGREKLVCPECKNEMTYHV